MKWNNKTALVTGGAGLIGSRIVNRLVKRGATVKVLDNLSAYPFDQSEHFGIKDLSSVQFIVGDIKSKDTVGNAVEGCDYIFHEAAFADVAATIWNPREDLESNVLGTFNLLEASRKHKIRRFIFASSAAVYGEQNASPGEKVPQFTEEMKPNPISTYANSKLWGEYEAGLYYNLYGLKTTALRYFSIYGVPQVPKKGSHSWVVAIFGMYLVKRKPLTVFGDGEQVRDFIYVDEAAEATILAAERDTTINKAVNVGTGKPTTINRIAEIFVNLANFKVQVEPRPKPKGDPFGGYADTTLMKELLDWEPNIALEDGVKMYYEWVINNKKAIPDWL
jgi:nucleoside-diphosphate-sugar epimerase